MEKQIYLDHAATTAVDSRVVEKMLPYFSGVYGNASSQHFYGRKAQQALDEARDTIASLLHAQPSEIYFTSGGTEADNWAMKGIALANESKGKHVITTAIEHPAMLGACKDLEAMGFEITYLSVDKTGLISLDELKSVIREDTILISCMYANNEIGTIQPVEEIAAIAKEKKVIFFTDAVQAIPYIDIDVKKIGVDAMAISGHKFNGPKGIGVLYVRNGVKIKSLLSGGHQERTKRGGTSNVAGAVGIAEALRLSRLSLEENNAKIKELRDHFVKRVKEEIPYSYYNGHEQLRVPSNADFSFEFIEGESILFSLDIEGIAVSSGSACSSGSLEPSHVLLAIGVEEALAHGSIRFSFGKSNTIEEVDFVVDKLKEIIARLRMMSPLYKG